MKLRTSVTICIAAVIAAACTKNTTDVTVAKTLTGTWSTTYSGQLYNVVLHLTEQTTENIVGDWAAYDANCFPLLSTACQRHGTVSAGYRHDTQVQLEMAPSSACGVVNATIDVTLTNANSGSGTVTTHRCNDADYATRPISLNRQ
jgi:hypothetical protein